VWGGRRGGTWRFSCCSIGKLRSCWEYTVIRRLGRDRFALEVGSLVPRGSQFALGSRDVAMARCEEISIHVDAANQGMGVHMSSSSDCAMEGDGAVGKHQAGVLVDDACGSGRLGWRHSVSGVRGSRRTGISATMNRTLIFACECIGHSTEAPLFFTISLPLSLPACSLGDISPCLCSRLTRRSAGTVLDPMRAPTFAKIICPATPIVEACHESQCGKRACAKLGVAES